MITSFNKKKYVGMSINYFICVLNTPTTSVVSVKEKWLLEKIPNGTNGMAGAKVLSAVDQCIEKLASSRSRNPLTASIRIIPDV